ncbi:MULTISPECIES: response regulator [Paenibacillus]|uniref:response regulator n=1 Tax=Paenibacillus TaxID=44249 RepID=UPI0022B8BA26|nr:response regulator [Paenibacillus caseinilyticus]MCZ8522014.1 response regulator [Paenibacillus caseinilyticus]
MILRLLLVDDEPRQLRAMMSIIQALRPEYEVHTATDGQEALTLMEEMSEAFDVIITDIQMPVMDGLQLLERLVQRGDGVKVVLLSGYGEFAYAQQAIRMGIFDYLVKPVGKADIESLLQKMDLALLKEKQEHRKVTELTRRLGDSLPAYRVQLLRRWLHGSSSPDGEELRAHMAAAYMDCSGLVYTAKLCRGKIHTDERRQELLTCVGRELAERLSSGTGVISLTMEESTGLLVTLVLCERDAFPGVKRIASWLEQGASQLAAQYEVNVRVGIGLPLDASIWDSGPQCYQHAALALEQGFFHGTQQVVVWEEQPLNTSGSIDVFEREQQFAAAVSGCDVEETHEFLNRLVEQTKRCRPLSPAQVKADVARLILNRLREAKHLLASEEAYTSLAGLIQERVLDCEDYRELRHWAKKLALQIIGLYESASQDKNSLVIHKCKEYIRERCGEELTLEHLAQRFHFNPSYFSTLFKTYTGMNLTDYLTKIRLDRAQHMLMNTDEKIADIARKVGYKEAGYFIRLFKREKGTSPKRYRSLNGKE